MFMTVTVRTMMGEEWEFLVSQKTSVVDLKLAIFTNLNRMHPDTQVGLFKMLVLIMVTQVLTYLGEEMEEDEETMADYDIQVERNYMF